MAFEERFSAWLDFGDAEGLVVNRWVEGAKCEKIVKEDFDLPDAPCDANGVPSAIQCGGFRRQDGSARHGSAFPLPFFRKMVQHESRLHTCFRRAIDMEVEGILSARAGEFQIREHVAGFQFGWDAAGAETKCQFAAFGFRYGNVTNADAEFRSLVRCIISGIEGRIVRGRAGSRCHALSSGRCQILPGFEE